MKLVWKTARAAALTSLIAACGAPPADIAKTAPVAPLVAPVTAPTAPADLSQVAPLPVPESAQGAGAAAGAAAKFASWGAVHALIGSTVKLGKMVSDSEGIALTADNLVGVTKDGGTTWGFMRHGNGVVLAIAGKAGGPFLAVGKAGYASLSADGKVWNDLPRYTNEDLIAVAVDAPGIVAVTKSGSFFVQYGLDGKTGTLGAFPDKIKAKDVVASGGGFIATAGKVPYTSLDGTVWAAAANPTAVATAKAFPTSQGLCSLGKVDKMTGVVCEVKGQAFGLTDASSIVVQKGLVFTTSNGGASWKGAVPPIASVNGVVGSGSNLVAYGNGGAIATSADSGGSWTLVTNEQTKSYKAAYVDGATVILAGDGGAMVRSTDGGTTFATVVTPQTGAFKQLAKLDDGRLVASLGAKGVESTDGGATWVDMADPAPLATLVAPAKPGKCEGRVPAANEACALVKQVKSPLMLPNAKGVAFTGEHGIAYGDFGLVMTTKDGGANWTAQSGFAVKAFDVFDSRDAVVLAIGGKDVVVSTDGGKSFQRYLLPKEAGRVRAVHITAGGQFMYAVGDNGMILRAVGADPSNWQLLDVGNVAGGGKKVTAGFFGIHEVGATPEAGGILFVVGGRGELYRSENRGDAWTPIATGTAQTVQRMAAEGTTVVAVTYSNRDGGNLLLKSDDSGNHFYIAREISGQGAVDVLSLAGGVLKYRDRTSSDFGATWTRDPDERYWSGAVDTFDSGLRIVSNDSYRSRDTTYLIGPEKDDWVILDGVLTRNARFECGKDSGCWMLYGGQVYRPL